MRKVLTTVIVLALACCSSNAFAGQAWTDGDGDGLPDGAATLASPSDNIQVDVWFDAQGFTATNYIAFVEWDPSCFSYVSAGYVIGGTQFPLDTFSHPFAVGWGGFGFAPFNGVQQIGFLTVHLDVASANCCVNPIIDYYNPYYVYCILNNPSGYQGFTSGYGTCVFSGTPDPIEACCFSDGSCQMLTAADCANAGGVNQGPASTCSPNPCQQPSEACCFADGSCIETDPSSCVAQGGTPQGPGSSCNPNNCPQPTEACCFADGTCQDLTVADCQAAGGAPQGAGSSCASVVCEDTRPQACCFSDGSCQDLTLADCAAAGGVSQGIGSDCANTICEGPSATESKSWGEIKGLYR